LRVGPHPAQRIGGNKNVHKISHADASVSHRVAPTYSISEWPQIEAILFESGRRHGGFGVQHLAPARKQLSRNAQATMNSCFA
jgi:hypothetical protein